MNPDSENENKGNILLVLEIQSDKLVGLADRALYDAKQQGRDRFSIGL